MQRSTGSGVTYNGKTIHKMGTLQKEGKMSSLFKLAQAADGPWRARWVVLTDGTLFYWKDEAEFRTGKVHKGLVDLRCHAHARGLCLVRFSLFVTRWVLVCGRTVAGTAHSPRRSSTRTSHFHSEFSTQNGETTSSMWGTSRI